MGDLAASLPGCKLYVVNISRNDPNVVWIYEIFDNPESHAALNELAGAAALSARVMPLLAVEPEIVQLDLMGSVGIG